MRFHALGSAWNVQNRLEHGKKFRCDSKRFGILVGPKCWESRNISKRRAERIIRTLVEKAETMRLQACLPQSWWEFALDHTFHVYNRTPIHRLGWKTPSRMLDGEKPSISHLRVFGCLAYIFIPEEVRTNKMAPKSERMTYLGNHPGGKGWIFMRGPNNIIFSAAQAIFDKAAFPKCPKTSMTQNTRLRVQAPTPGPHHNDGHHSPPSGQELDGDEDNEIPPTSPKSKGKERAQEQLCQEHGFFTLFKPLTPLV